MSRLASDSTRPIRAVIVDDEPLACVLLRELLGQYADVEVIASAATAAEAAAICAEKAPDVLFLDINMPMGSGLDLARTLHPAPAIVFTTAHAEFAIPAFDVNAVDYLLKPVDKERLDRALIRLRQKLARPETALPLAAPPGGRVAFRLKSEIVFIAPDAIEWIGAEGNYCRVYTTGKPLLIREMLSSIEQRLDPRRFVRVHRSAIINLDALQKLLIDPQGRYSAVLQSGTRVRVGVTHRHELQRLYGDVL
jgi:two-component system LytT family response regulator